MNDILPPPLYIYFRARPPLRGTTRRNKQTNAAHMRNWEVLKYMGGRNVVTC